MIRFDIVVANYNKADVFWEGFSNLKNFDPLLDRVVFLDCSNNSLHELAVCQHYINALGINGCNFVFIKRRNWLLNPGAQLDYVRLVAEGKLAKPLHAFFMQDHYLNKQRLVKGDTIPESVILDLDHISDILLQNNKLAVSATRYGFRLCASVPEELCGEDYACYDDSYNYPWLFVDCRQPIGSIIGGKYCNDHFIYYNGCLHMPGSKDICLVIDGSNFCVDPIYYINHYNQHKAMYSGGIGDYGEGLTWEARLSKILTDQGVGFYELSRSVCFWSPEELKSAQPDPDPAKLWCYFYNSPLFYWIHAGHDIWPYRFKNTDAYLRYAQYCIEFRKSIDPNKSFQILYDPKCMIK